jgi:hypothetical protein
MIAICANIGSPPFSPISISTSAVAIMSDVSSGFKVEELRTSICHPLCPQTRTLLEAAGTSHLCQQLTF